MRQVAVLFGVSTAGVCRVIHRLGPLLALEPVRRPQGADERLWIVDGTQRGEGLHHAVQTVAHMHNLVLAA